MGSGTCSCLGQFHNVIFHWLLCFMALLTLQKILHETVEKLHKMESDLEEMTRKKEAESQRVRELETQLRQLQTLLQDKEEEIRVRCWDMMGERRGGGEMRMWSWSE